jgi:hypothetical protein
MHIPLASGTRVGFAVMKNIIPEEAERGEWFVCDLTEGARADIVSLLIVGLMDGGRLWLYCRLPLMPDVLGTCVLLKMTTTCYSRYLV